MTDWKPGDMAWEQSFCSRYLVRVDRTPPDWSGRDDAVFTRCVISGYGSHVAPHQLTRLTAAELAAYQLAQLAEGGL